MPVLSAPSSLNVLVGRTVSDASDPKPLQVVCSWPLSGQYGGGSRILYYVLVAACVLARKTEWLRNACLAAALIFPATAAIHAIVLASLHTDGAVDMDIYGALQMCSIGILTASATARLSKTYFNNPGRNVLFVWTVLVVAGLLALTVEFFRTEAKDCKDSNGNPIKKLDGFPGDTNQNFSVICNVVCTEGNPYSPMRTGSADNINLVPKPNELTFGAATLVAAASCVPGILSMVSIWNKIAKINWRKQFGPDVDDQNAEDQIIEGTNGATPRGMKIVNDVIRRLLSVVEIPVFSGAVISLIVVGERNFWSDPLHYDIEPIWNIGQWSSIVASVFAAIGSLYMMLAKFLEKAEKEGSIEEPLCHCHDHCMCHTNGSSRPSSLNDDLETAQPLHPSPAAFSNTNLRIMRNATAPVPSPSRMDTFPDNEDEACGLGIRPIDTNATSGSKRSGLIEAAIRVAKAMETVSPKRFDLTDFRQGQAQGFPEIPGELARCRDLPRIIQQWGGPPVDPEEGLGVPRGRRSRASSVCGRRSRANSVAPRSRSVCSRRARSGSVAPREHSPKPPPQTSANEPETLMPDQPITHSPESTSESIFSSRMSVEIEKTKSRGTVITLHEGKDYPDIVLSPYDQGDASQPPMTVSSSIETTQVSEKVEDTIPEARLMIPSGERSAQQSTTTEHHVFSQAATRSPPLGQQPTSYPEQTVRSNESPSSQTSAVARQSTPAQQVAPARSTDLPAIEDQPSSSRARDVRRNEAPRAETEELVSKNKTLQVPQPTAAYLSPEKQRPPLDHVEAEVVKHMEEPNIQTVDAGQQAVVSRQSASFTTATSGLVARPPLHRVEDAMSDRKEESPPAEPAGQVTKQKRSPQPVDGRTAEKAPLSSPETREENQE